MKFQHSLLALTLALSLAACTAAPQLPLAPDTQAPAMNEPLAQLAAPEEIEDPNAYRSLVIKDDGFATKALVSKSRRAVVVTIGTSSYTLTYKFMRKLRFLMSQSPYIQADSTQALALTGFFTRMKASATTNVAASGTTTEPLFGPTNPTSVPYLYTLSTSEAAFVAKLETYQGVIMPNYLQEAETYTESTGSHDAVNGNDPGTIRLIVNKTGVRTDFFRAIHDSLSTDFDYGTNNVLDKSDLDSATGAAVWYDSGTGEPSGSLFKYDNNGDLIADITTVEKTLLSSIVAKNPYAEDVILLDDNGDIVVGDISLYYGDPDIIAPTAAGMTTADAELVLANLGMRNRVNTTFDLGSGSNVLKEPTSSANYSLAASFFGGLMRAVPLTFHEEMEGAYTAYDSLRGINAVTGMPTSYDMLDVGGGEDMGDLNYRDVHRVIRGFHMLAGGATFTAAPVNTLSFGTISAPTAAATPTITALSSTERGKMGNFIVTGDFGLTPYKIGKSTQTTLKNQLGITMFFDYGVDASFLLVPTTRNATTGALTFSSTGTHWVAVFGKDNAGAYDYYVYDPGYESASGNGFYQMTATQQTALNNYGGTVIGIQP